MEQDTSGCDKWRQVPQSLLLSPASRWQELSILGDHLMPKSGELRERNHATRRALKCTAWEKWHRKEGGLISGSPTRNWVLQRMQQSVEQRTQVLQSDWPWFKFWLRLLLAKQCQLATHPERCGDLCSLQWASVVHKHYIHWSTQSSIDGSSLLRIYSIFGIQLKYWILQLITFAKAFLWFRHRTDTMSLPHILLLQASHRPPQAHHERGLHEGGTLGRQGLLGTIFGK